MELARGLVHLFGSYFIVDIDVFQFVVKHLVGYHLSFCLGGFLLNIIIFKKSVMLSFYLSDDFQVVLDSFIVSL